MAALGAEVAGSCFLSSGFVCFFVLLLIVSIFLTAQCTDCGRRSFELKDTVERNPSTLIRVVKLEETMVARENPMINEIRNDEKDVQTYSSTEGKNRARGSETAGEPNPEEEYSVLGWRNHLGVPQSQDMDPSSNPDSNHVYHTAGGAVSAPSTNHHAGEDRNAVSVATPNVVYAKVSKKNRGGGPSAHTPEQVQVEEDESSPPLPDRRGQLDV